MTQSTGYQPKGDSVDHRPKNTGLVTMANAYIKACVDAYLAQTRGDHERAVCCSKLADIIEDVYPDAADAARIANGGTL